MSYTRKWTEEHYLLAHIPADSETTAVTSGWLSLTNYPRVIVLISVGDMAQGATFDVAITQATDTSGTGAKAISGKSITQMQAALLDSDSAVAIELRTDELDVTNNFDCILVTCTPAVAAVEFSVMVFGFISRYKRVGWTPWHEIVP